MIGSDMIALHLWPHQIHVICTNVRDVEGIARKASTDDYERGGQEPGGT